MSNQITITVTVTREARHEVRRSMLRIEQRFQTYRTVSATKRFVKGG